MKKPLLDVIFASEKRKNVLLLLGSGPKKMETILDHLKTTRPALLPQTRILEDHHLITQFDDIYQLTTIGKLLIRQVEPLLLTVDVLDEDIDYWGSRKLDFLPEHLLERIGELSDSMITEPESMDIHDINHEFYERSLDSKNVYFICRFVYPNFGQLGKEWIKNRTNVSIIVDKGLLEKIRDSYADVFRTFIKSGYVKLFLYPEEIRFMKFGLTDSAFFLLLFNQNIRYDNKYLLSFSQSSLEWAKELFEHYCKESTPVPVEDI
ncbi:winged helix-turn-helix domain-containing protein [Methanolobus zinderi]|uniref:Winged helix-turn-helix domain-containing protein n=1 Tax=Methanolobus zinderi TaxID=536044 RepID=A0A7D5HZX4_9EURY|nr:winged helix-turn-helix domain-containing protein [Methanolobus zinderi]QLC49326.1 winged helix-turn-helix domain-containing protein [Methanolobus zinderi]